MIDSLLPSPDTAAGDFEPAAFGPHIHLEDHVREVFRRRARQLAQRRTDDCPSGKLENVLIVAVAAEHYALPVRDLRHVCRCSPITRIPGARRELLGLANVQETVRSVYDLGGLLGLTDVTTSASFFLLVRLAMREIVLAVDQLRETRHISCGELATVGDTISQDYWPYVRGLTTDNVVVLDVQALRRHSALTAVCDSGQWEGEHPFQRLDMENET